MVSGHDVLRTQPRGRSLPAFPLRWFEEAWSRRQDPHFQILASLAVLLTLATGAFLHIVEDYLDNDPIVRWDVEFSRWLHVHSNGTLRSFFEVVTYAGNVALLALLALAITFWLIRRRRFNEAALIALSAAGIELLNGVLKLLFHRPRPELAYVHLDTYSFPSGHAAGTTAIYAVVLYVLASHLSSIPSRVFVAIGFVLLVVLVGFSRLYLEVHYLSDVLAGTSLGAAWACAALFVYEMKRDGDIIARLPSAAVGLIERLAGGSRPSSRRS
jgi:membrane-associated phospholipid phosphatase